MDYVHWPEAKVIRRVRLNSSHRPTGHVANHDGDQLLPPPAELVIATQDSLYRHSIREPVTQVTNYHTFYLDETGVIRGEDNHGLEASQSTPPVNFNQRYPERDSEMSRSSRYGDND